MKNETLSQKYVYAHAAEILRTDACLIITLTWYADFEMRARKIKYFYACRNFTLLWRNDYCISNTNIYFFASTHFLLGSLQKLLTLLRHRKLWTVCLSTKSFIAKGNWILSGRGKYGWKTGVAMVTYRVIAK